MTYTNGHDSASIGAGSSDDLASLGLPIYPAIQPATANVIKSTTSSGSNMTVITKVPDDFKAVDDWYESKLGSDFKRSRMDMAGLHMTTFVKEDGNLHESILLQANKEDGKDVVAITLLVDKKP